MLFASFGSALLIVCILEIPFLMGVGVLNTVKYWFSKIERDKRHYLIMIGLDFMSLQIALLALWLILKSMYI